LFSSHTLSFAHFFSGLRSVWVIDTTFYRALQTGRHQDCWTSGHSALGVGLMQSSVHE